MSLTSRWWNIVGIRRRSRVSNNAWDFDLAMWSTLVDHANYGFQRASRAGNCGLCRVFLIDWWNDTHLSLASVHGGTTQHSSTQPWKWLHGVLERKKKKKTPSGACAPLGHADLSLDCRAKFLSSIHTIRSDPWSDPWSDP